MTFDALFEDRITRVLAKGRALGWLSPEMVMDALAHVELSTALIDEVVTRIRSQGIEYRDDAPDELINEAGDAAGSCHSPEADGSEVQLHPQAVQPSATERSTLSPGARLGRPHPSRPPHRAPSGRPSAKTSSARRKSSPGSGVRDSAAGAPDPVHAYLKEIGKIRLLSPSEEVAVARRIAAGLRAGDRIMELRGQFSPGEVPRAELDAQFRILSDGLKAKALLVESNLRLVVSIAKRHRVRGMLLLDLVQEGNLGLIRAVEKFDYTRGFRFSTYATWWIRQAINRAIAEQARTIRVPAHVVEAINRVTRIQYQLVQDGGHEPTVDELARMTELPVERIHEILRLNQEPVSIDQPVGEGEEVTLSDVIEDHAATIPADAAARALLNEAVSKALEQLSEREREILRLRFGLEDGQVRTLEEVGKVIGLTRERIRQIEVKTLAKLRYPSNCQPLREYLDEA